MRTPKFRGWDGTIMHNDVQSESRLDNLQAHGWKLCEYTGLVDKGGKDIYEGDIVRVIHTDRPYSNAKRRKTFNCPVIFYKGGFDYEWPKNYGDFRCGEHLENTEVVGNIFQNPELLHEWRK